MPLPPSLPPSLLLGFTSLLLPPPHPSPTMQAGRRRAMYIFPSLPFLGSPRKKVHNLSSAPPSRLFRRFHYAYVVKGGRQTWREGRKMRDGRRYQQHSHSVFPLLPFLTLTLSLNLFLLPFWVALLLLLLPIIGPLITTASSLLLPPLSSKLALIYLCYVLVIVVLFLPAVNFRWAFL